MNFPIIDLNTPTQLMFEWGWMLVTRANFVVYVLVIAVFLLGAFVRLPRAKRDLAAAERQTTARLQGKGDDRE